jgi:hypothetical protein
LWGTQYLINLTGLEGLNSIGGDLNIMGNSGLNSLMGLENLTVIGGSLAIHGNDILISLTGLESLNVIGGELSIGNNTFLSSLSGLDSIEAGSITDIVIIENTALTTCNVQSICDYIASPNGSIEIHDNAVGCNNQIEVETACGVGLEENRQSEHLVRIYPNPSSTSITLELPNTKSVYNTTLTIYNVNFQQAISLRITEITTEVDISTLSCGVYFVRLTNDSTVQFGKFVKQ